MKSQYCTVFEREIYSSQQRPLCERGPVFWKSSNSACTCNITDAGRHAGPAEKLYTGGAAAAAAAAADIDAAAIDSNE